ncbi:MAG: hypothetical protein A2Z16_09930 [Chloroflexi bacterium RBG_16_54_18]|nr:MAG: hypothetical protein A2Z16_09930 [Chloroflexi bacterium RBG_16_54_18]
MEQLDPVILRITKSQIAFYHRRAFAWAWIPSRYLPRATAPLVLSLSLHRRDPSTRWKEIVEPAAGHFMHHLELFSVDQLDVQLLGWLQEAFILAG